VRSSVYSLPLQCFVKASRTWANSTKNEFAKNVWWLGLLQLSAWGENWHDHHRFANSARFG
jgi:fatty-acid desaturase